LVCAVLLAQVMTKALYTQHKFNLYREENEGYAKLITDLENCSTWTESSINFAISNVRSLIGFFYLDPNRVFDVVLDVYERHPENHLFLNILEIFPRSSLSQLLGFKMQGYQRAGVGSETTPLSL
jgi:THO complex subunit 2